ncbi:MAG: hypothetical protein IKI27_04260 [Methanobrevibacter sp.]|nr:hypothetical protein [Methanobrevibacter sp.]
MSVKGWAEAHRYKGGIIKYLYDKVTALDSASGGDETDIAALKTAVGDSDSGLVKSVADINTAIGDASSPAEGTILARIAALESKE